MSVFCDINKILCNKLFLYIFTRYVTYFILFVSSLYIAIKLGPYYFGIWGIIQLLLSISGILDFGIPNSINILMVQSKDDEQRKKNYIKSAHFFLAIIALLYISIASYHYFFPISFFDKYLIGSFIPFICLIAILQQYAKLYMNIYRVKNRLLELSFSQTITPLLVFLVIFFVEGSNLIWSLIYMYLIGFILSVILFISRKQIPFGGSLAVADTKVVINKGFFLFIYNGSFYLIVYSTSAIASIFYSVEQYGYYSFSYMLAHSVLLLLEAFGFIIFPKIIDKLRSSSTEDLENLIKRIRTNYVVVAHGMMYVAYALFPLLIKLVPKYQDALMSLSVAAIAMMLYTNAFGYNTYLMAQNKEKVISKASLIGLFSSVVAALIIAKLGLDYSYIFYAIMIGYFNFSYSCVYYGKKHLKQPTNFGHLMGSFFPIKLLLPYCVAIIITLLNVSYLSAVPLLMFLLLNCKEIQKNIMTIKMIINKPNIIDL